MEKTVLWVIHPPHLPPPHKREEVWLLLISSQERDFNRATQRAGYMSPAISGIPLMVFGSSLEKVRR